MGWSKAATWDWNWNAIAHDVYDGNLIHMFSYTNDTGSDVFITSCHIALASGQNTYTGNGSATGDGSKFRA
jgi:hypothetical protein